MLWWRKMSCCWVHQFYSITEGRSIYQRAHTMWTTEAKVSEKVESWERVFVIARIFFLLLLNCSAWACLVPAEQCLGKTVLPVLALSYIKCHVSCRQLGWWPDGQVPPFSIQCSHHTHPLSLGPSINDILWDLFTVWNSCNHATNFFGHIPYSVIHPLVVDV